MWAIENAKLYTVSDGIIEQGMLIVDNGKIKAVGKNLNLSGVETVYNVNNKPVTPGLIDVHTHLGIEEEIYPEGEDTNEMTNPLTPELMAYDGVNFFDIGFKDAFHAGITTAMITMGSANVIGGVTTTVKTGGISLERQIVQKVSGLKMAFGENPKKVYGKKDKTPQTRMAIMALARKAFYDAIHYKEKRERQEVPYDLGMEHLLLALNKKIPVRLHAHRADDLLQALNLRDEFDLDMILEHCTDASKIATILKERNAKCAIGPAFVNRAKVEMENVGYSVGKVLSDASVPMAILTDHPVNPLWYLPICVGLYIREGLDLEAALKAVTLTAAEFLNCSDRLGTLTPGKDADLVVWSDDIFTLTSKAEMVFIEGIQYK